MKNSDETREAAIKVIRQAGERWPTTFVPRSKVSQFTGGLIATGTLANCDCEGIGPKGSFRIGRQICYPTSSLCDWLISKLA